MPTIRLNMFALFLLYFWISRTTHHTSLLRQRQIYGLLTLVMRHLLEAPSGTELDSRGFVIDSSGFLNVLEGQALRKTARIGFTVISGPPNFTKSQK